MYEFQTLWIWVYIYKARKIFQKRSAKKLHFEDSPQQQKMNTNFEALAVLNLLYGLSRSFKSFIILATSKGFIHIWRYSKSEKFQIWRDFLSDSFNFRRRDSLLKNIFWRCFFLEGFFGEGIFLFEGIHSWKKFPKGITH